MNDAPALLKIPKSECPDILIRLPEHKRPKSWSSMENPVVLLERKLYGHPWAGLSWERQFEKVLLEHGWEKVPNWECLFVNREKGLFLSVYVDEIKNGKTETQSEPHVENTHERRWFARTNIIPWPCLFRLHSTRMQNKQRYCGQLQGYVWIRMSTGALENFHYSEKSEAIISSWSYDMEGHAKKCVERYCELANKTSQQLHAVATPWIDDHQFKGEEMGSVRELSKVCSQIVLKSPYVARIGRPDILCPWRILLVLSQNGQSL